MNVLAKDLAHAAAILQIWIPKLSWVQVLLDPLSIGGLEKALVPTSCLGLLLVAKDK